MSAKYVRDYYQVDYKRGDRVTVDGRRGTIVSFPSQYLGVRFDGEKHTSRAHPTWKVARIPAPVIVTEAIDSTGKLVPVDCTWNGTTDWRGTRPGGTGPWDFREDIDPVAPVLVCDVHNGVAHRVVYDSDPECTGTYVGPCEVYEIPGSPGVERAERWKP